MSRVVMVGLDGATWDIINPLLAKGELPNLKRLMDEGVSGDLKSTAPPLSAPAWATYLTGKHPAKHGVYAFESRSILQGSYKFRPANGNDVRSFTLAEIATRNNLRTVQVNVPMTFPARQINGIWVAGLDTPTNDVTYTYPAELSEKLNKMYDYVIEPSSECKTGEEQILLDRVTHSERQRAKASIDLFKQEKWDLFMTVMRGTDILAHQFWHYMDPSHPKHNAEEAKQFGSVLYDHYKMMDGVVGDFLNQLPADTNIIVVSDHGFGSHLRWVYIDQLFFDKQLLQSTKSSKNGGVSLTSLLWKVLHNTGLVKVAQILVPKKTRKNVGQSLSPLNNLDWDTSLTYPMVGQSLVRLNMKGRDPRGGVESADREAVIKRITDVLMDLKDPNTGEKVVDAVTKWEDYYPYTDIDSPDLIVHWKDGYVGKRGMSPNTTTYMSAYVQKPSGNHRMNGVIFAAGPDIKKGGKVEGAGLVDVAPTILHLLGLPVPDDMDGKVLSALWREPMPPVQFEPAPTYSESDYLNYSESDQEVIEKRLADLGYI